TKTGNQFEFNDSLGSLQDLRTHIDSRLKSQTALILQPLVRPHSRMLEISSSKGLPTIRILTRIQNNTPEVLIACAKLPVGESISDSFSNGMTGNLLAAVDLDTGTLSTAYGPR